MAGRRRSAATVPAREPMRVATVLLAAVRGVVGRLGYDLGREPPLPSTPRAPAEMLDALLDRAALALGDETLGLSIARALPAGVFGEIDYLFSTSATLREGYSRVFRSYRFYSDRLRFVASFDGLVGCVKLICVPGQRVSAHALDGVLAGAFQRARYAIGPEFQLREVVLSPRSAPLSVYEREFDAPVRFGNFTDRDELYFDSRWLEAPLRTAAPSVVAKLEDTVRGRIGDLEDLFLLSARDAIAQALREGDVGIAAAARRLGMSTRTLQRELTSRGASHRALLDEIRRRLAPELLAEEGASLATVAARLGYSEVSAFVRARRRWRGVHLGARGQ